MLEMYFFPKTCGLLACWLIKIIAMSLRSMNLSKVDSIVVLSVLLSTTRKFF